MRFGPFDIVRSLGAGGMAETSLAVRRGEGGFEQRVCLKRILPAYGKDKDFVRAFADEAKLAVRLEHPNICRLYDFGQLDGTYWMSLEICEGGDLRDLIRALGDMHQPMPTDVVVLLALDLAQALHYAHALAIDGQRVELVHRDISPSNVLIDGHGHFKLADFGIARAKTNSHVTQSGVVKGKAPYMSPDHVQGLRVDARDDLWSLGVMLYECLAGERPFAGATEMALMVKIMKGERRLLNEAAPGLPEVLVRAVERLLAHDREQRTPTAAALIEELESIAPPPSARLRLSKLVTTARAETEQREAEGLATTDPAAGRAPTAPTQPERGGGSSRAAPADVVAAPPSATTHTRSPSSGAAPTSDPPALGGARTEPDLTPPIITGTPRTAVSGPRASLGRVGFAGGAVGLLVIAVVTVSWFGPTWYSRPTAEPRAGGTPPAATPPASTSPPSASPIDPPPSTIAAAAELSVAEPHPSGAADPAPVEQSPTAEATTTSADRGIVELTAVPWGTLFIDGRRVGDGHVVRQLAAGTHRAGVGMDHPVHEESITVRAGQRIRLVLRATP